jgi:dipeptidyl aminopeptidase/acylaminoacyl peptidase
MSGKLNSADPSAAESNDGQTKVADNLREGTDNDSHDSREFSLEDLIRLPDYYHPVVSPDGDRVAFYYDETGRVELYVQDLQTGKREQISDGNVPRNAYPLAWARDGERIFFREDEDGDEQTDIHAMTLDGQREPLVTHEGQCVIQDVGPDGRYLLFGSTAGEQMNLYRYDLERDDSEQLTEYDQPVQDAIYGPNGEMVAYTTNETDDLDNRDAYVAETDGSNPRNLEIGETGAETWVNDWMDDRLLVSDNSTDLGRVGVYDFESDEIMWYGRGEYEEYGFRFTPSRDVLAMRTRECAILPVRYEGSGDEGTEFDFPEGVAAPVGTGTSRVVTDDGRVVTSFGTASERQQLVAYDLATGDHEPVIEAEYDDFDSTAFTDAEYVTYESHDDLEIDGLLYDSGERPSPALVMVHGGPHSQTLHRFSPVAQYLVSQGYSILAPNYRGSMGKGREFKNMIHGDWGGDEQGDIAEAGRWLKRQDWIDADRVAVFGGSYGGYSTFCQLTMYPDLWTTGVAVVGMTDLQRLYEESMPHFKTALEQQLGDPEENADRYRERSPITHIEDMERPIAILHGVNDPRCPISQARLFRDALDDMDWTEGTDADYEYHEFGEEGHGSTDTEQRIRQQQTLTDYIERRL